MNSCFNISSIGGAAGIHRISNKRFITQLVQSNTATYIMSNEIYSSSFRCLSFLVSNELVCSFSSSFSHFFLCPVLVLSRVDWLLVDRWSLMVVDWSLVDRWSLMVVDWSLIGRCLGRCNPHHIDHLVHRNPNVLHRNPNLGHRSPNGVFPNPIYVDNFPAVVRANTP